MRETQAAWWRSGDAADCKSAHPSSILGQASNLFKRLEEALILIFPYTFWDSSRDPGMAEAAAKHTLVGGKVHVYRREHPGSWQYST